MADRNDAGTAAEGRGTGEKAKDRVQEAGRKVSDAASDIRDRGEDLVEEGKEKAHELADQAGDAARSRADDEKDRVASGLRTVADALRRGGADLPSDRQSYGRFVQGVADRVDDVSYYLEQHDVDSLTRDVKRFARDHTPVFLGGAFVLGMAGARFLKSSNEDEVGHEAGRPDGDTRHGRSSSTLPATPGGRLGTPSGMGDGEPTPSYGGGSGRALPSDMAASPRTDPAAESAREGQKGGDDARGI